MVRITAWLCAAAAGLAAPPAKAALIEAVWTGTVRSGTDIAGTFGTPDGILDGYAYSATYVFDTERGVREAVRLSDFLYGGSERGVDTPLVSASFTLNGVTETLLGTYDAYAFAVSFTRGGFGYLEHFAAQAVDPVTGKPVTKRVEHHLEAGIWFGLPDFVDEPVTFTGLGTFPEETGPGGSLRASFFLQDCDAALAGCGVWAYGSLRPDTVTVSRVEPAPIPLPASGWLIGFPVAFLGLWGLRRRASRSHAPAAR